MKKVLFTISLLVSSLSIAALNAESLYNTLKVPEQEVSKIKCQKIFGQLTCIKIHDALLPQAQYYCKLKVTPNDSIRI